MINVVVQLPGTGYNPALIPGETLILSNNYTKAQRAAIIQEYAGEEIICTFVSICLDMWHKRIQHTPPPYTSDELTNIKFSLEQPTKDEGFDEIIIIDGNLL